MTELRTTKNGSVHPSRSRQSMTRAEKLLQRGYDRVSQEKWQSAIFFFGRAIDAAPDRCTQAIAPISIAGCKAAIIARDAIAAANAIDAATLPTPKAEYIRILTERQNEIPSGCNA